MRTMYSEPCPPERVNTRGAASGPPQCIGTQEVDFLPCPEGMTASGFQCTSSNRISPRECPPGHRMNSDYTRCERLDPIVCGAGESPHIVYLKNGSIRAFCIPDNAPTRPIPQMDDPRTWPCGDNEFVDSIRRVCIPPPTPAPNTSPSTTGGSSVNTPPPPAPTPPASPAAPPTAQTYEQDLAAYENAITQALATNDASKLPDIRARADRVIASLNKRIEDITYLRAETPDIRIERDRLLSVLRRIQNDYNGLLENTDDLETLRRIREQEGGAAKKEFMWYLIAFLIAVVALIGVIFVMGGQKALATAISPSTPAMSPPLM